DRGVGDSVLTDMRAGHATRLCWADSGDRMFFQASGPGTVDICSVDVGGSVRTELLAGERVVYDFDLRHGRLAACLSDACSPGDVFLLQEGQETRLTDSNSWLRRRYLARPRRLEFVAADG